MSARNVNLSLVFSDSRRIINANRGHFMALSFLFVLPLSLSAIVYSSLLKPTSFVSTYSRLLSPVLPGDEIPPPEKSGIMLIFIFSLFQLMFSFFSTASITHSILNGYFGEPLKFTSSLKSILVSFLPLTGTYITKVMILTLVYLAVGSLAGLTWGGILLWAEIDFRGVYFLVFVILLVALLVGVTVYFQLEWYLADVIVVVESKWGFTPLRRSSYLVKGMKTVAFSIYFLFTFLPGINPLFLSSSAPTPINGSFISWMLILVSVAVTGLVVIMRLYSVAATAVLFIHSKGLLGELAEAKIAVEFAPLNTPLPYDGYDQKEQV